VILNDAGASELEQSGRQILSRAGLAEFHAKEFNPAVESEVRAYEDFTRTLGDVLVRHGEYASFQLVHQDLFGEIFEDLAARIAGGVLAQLRPGRSEFIVDKAGALFALARDLSALPTTNSGVRVELDKSQDKDEVAGAVPVALSGTNAAIMTTSSAALVRIANAYKSQRFPGGPRIDDLSVVDSVASILVQAADVVANFGVNYVKAKLRVESLDVGPARTGAGTDVRGDLSPTAPSSGDAGCDNVKRSCWNP